MKLDTREVRTDLTDRECAKLLGGLIGSLLQVSERGAVRRAVQWWAARDAATWTELGDTAEALRDLTRRRGPEA